MTFQVFRQSADEVSVAVNTDDGRRLEFVSNVRHAQQLGRALTSVCADVVAGEPTVEVPGVLA